MADELKILRPRPGKLLGPGERHVYTDKELLAQEEHLRDLRENHKPLFTSDDGLDPELRKELRQLLTDIKLREQLREHEELMCELMQTCTSRSEEPSEGELNRQIDEQIRFAESMSRSEQGDDDGNAKETNLSS